MRAEELHRPKLAHGGLAARMYLDGTLPAHADIGAQRRLDAMPAEVPLTLEEREIAFLDPPFS